MLEQRDMVAQSPGSATASQITGCFSRSSPWFRKLLRAAVILKSVLVPARGRSQMRANYCSCNSSWRHQSPSGHGQPLCNRELHPESFRWRWIWDVCDAKAARLPPCRCLPQPVSPVLHQQAQAAKVNVTRSLLADAPSFSITCSPIPITRRRARRKSHRSQWSHAA